MKTLPTILVAGAMTLCAAVWSFVPLDGLVPTAAAAPRKPAEPLQLPAGMTEDDRDIITYAMRIWPATVPGSAPSNYLDADTFDIMVGPPGWTKLKVRFRVRNINAPEARSFKCTAEKVLAAKATDFVRNTLSAPGAVIQVTNKGGFDKDGRYLARIQVNGEDLGEMLMAQNPPLARVWTENYQGQTKDHWCREATN